MAEALFGRALDVGVDGQLEHVAVARDLSPDLVNLAADAVDGDLLVAVGAHQVAVVRLLDARLADDGARIDAVVLGPRELLLAHLTDVSEQVRGHVAGGVPARRHLLGNDPGQFEAARAHGNDLLDRGVVDEDDGTVAGLAPPAVHDLPETCLVLAGRGGERPERLLDVLRLLAHERDVEAVPVLDEHLAVPVEQHAARRRQGQAADVVVLRHLAEPLVLGDLENPEPHRQRRKGDGDQILQHGQPQRQAAAVVRQHAGVRHTRP